MEQRYSALLHLFSAYRGRQLDLLVCRELASYVASALGYGGLRGIKVADRVFQMLIQYIPRTLSGRWCDIFARQLSARHRELEMSVISVYTGPVREEWVPVEIFSATKTEKSGKSAHLLEFYCFGGHVAGFRLRQVIPDRWLSWLAYRVGFSRRWQYDYQPEQLIGFQLWAHVKLPEEDGGDVALDEWDVSSAMLRHNKSIIKRRFRLDVEPHRIPDGKEEEYSCPLDKDSYCSECSADVYVCPAATNRERING